MPGEPVQADDNERRKTCRYLTDNRSLRCGWILSRPGWIDMRSLVVRVLKA